ncbi:MAG: TolC family protein [Verrucomicrobiota bacterium]
MKILCHVEHPASVVGRACIRIGVVLSLLVSVASVSLAGKGSPESQTVGQLVERALTHNAELALYQTEVEVAKGQRIQAARLKNPQLSTEGSYRKVQELEGDRNQETGFVFGVSLVQTFEFPGKASLRKAIADRDIQVAELGLAQFRLTLSGKVRQLAARYQAAVELEKLTSQINERSSGLVALLKERPLAGSRPLLEMRAIQANQAELTETAKEAEIMKSQTQAELNRLLGYPPARPIHLQDELVMPARPELPALEELLSLCFTRNLQLKIQEAELDRARLSLDAERLASAPDFEIGPFYSQEETGAEREITIGASVALELPIWDQNQGNIVSARAMQKMAQAKLAIAQRKVEQELTLRWITYQANRKQAEGFDLSIREDLQASAALADRQYRQGAIDVQLYLESQRSLINTIKIYNNTVLQLGDSLLDLELLSGGAFSSEITEEEQP